MARRVSVLCFFLALGAAVAFAKSNTPTQNTRAAVKAYVESAAKYVAEHGPDCATLKSADWMAGDYYVFVQEPDGKLVCHPNAAMVGKPASAIVDANGKNVGTALAEAAKKKDGGWVEYVWPRPGTDKPVSKSSYAMSVKAKDGKTYYVGGGGYELR